MTVTRSGRRATRRGGSVRAWRGADESLCDLVAEAPPVPPRLLASHRIWTAGGQGVCAATVLWAAGGREPRAEAEAQRVRAERAEAQVATLIAHIYRLAALEQARRALDDASAGAEHEESDGDASG